MQSLSFEKRRANGSAALQSLPITSPPSSSLACVFWSSLVSQTCRNHPRLVTLWLGTHRVFTDSQFTAAGAALQEDISPASVILGVKEVPVELLIPNRTSVLSQFPPLFVSLTLSTQLHVFWPRHQGAASQVSAPSSGSVSVVQQPPVEASERLQCFTA